MLPHPDFNRALKDYLTLMIKASSVYPGVERKRGHGSENLMKCDSRI
jgi:hypothetical protein